MRGWRRWRQREGRAGRGGGRDLSPPLGSGDGGKPCWACASLRPKEVGPTSRACGAEADGEEELAHPGAILSHGGEGEAPLRRGARAGSRRTAALQLLHQLGGSGRRRRALAVYEASPGAQCAGLGGSRHAWSWRAFRRSHSRVGTSPGPQDGGIWPRVGRSSTRFNLLLMNLFQKVRDLQLEACECLLARARAAGV